MKLSVITPCSRPHNLPTIYKTLLDLNGDVEWIVVFDGDIDDRIKMYEEESVPIYLFNKYREIGDSYASMLRNIGIENARGDYLYFLDDDNLVHPFLYRKIQAHTRNKKYPLLIFNQFSIRKERRISNFDLKKNRGGYIDTAQIVVSKECGSRWDNSEPYFDEYPYITKLIKEVGEDNILWVDRCYSYRNYLRRFEIIK